MQKKNGTNSVWHAIRMGNDGAGTYPWDAGLPGGKEIEIATRMIEERNRSRINSYIQSGDLEGLEIVKQSNLKTYGNELERV